MQRRLREQQPPRKLPHRMWVGTDADGLAAAALVEELDGPGSVFLCLMAVAERHRRQGGGYGDEMVEFILDMVAERAIEHRLLEVTIEARIHRLNHASQHLARRWYFRHTAWVEPGSEYQVWAAVLELPHAETGVQPAAPEPGLVLR